MSRAERLPSRTRCFRRLRLSAIMLVSAIEKNPATSSITASAANSHVRGIWSDIGAGGQPRLQDDLEDELAAEVGEQQRGEPPERPVHRALAAPAAEVAAPEERAEDDPGEHPEDRLVRELERAPKSCSEKNTPETTVSVSSTNAAKRMRKRSASISSSGGRLRRNGGITPRCSHFSSASITSACMVATMNRL